MMTQRTGLVWGGGRRGASAGFALTAILLLVMANFAGAQAARIAPQAVAAVPPTFDAISIKEYSPQSRGAVSKAGLVDPSEWRAQYMPLVWIVDDAYGIPFADRDLMVGLPRWAYTDYFNIAARVPLSPRGAQVLAMVQAMLADRFQLKVHWEARPMRAVALTVAPGGPKMQPDPACESPNRPLDPRPMISGVLGMLATAEKNPPCGTISNSLADGVLARVYHGMTMPLLAAVLSQPGLPVVDRTQLGGAYDFTLREPRIDTAGFTPEQMQALRAQGQHDIERVYEKQLGLKIEYSKTTKLPVQVLVIDRVEKPTAN